MNQTRSTVAIICTMLTALGVLGWALTNYLQTSKHHAEFLENISEIQYLDEVFTMSARMAASTGAPEWEERYVGHFGRLDKAITRATELASDQFEQDLNALAEANEILIVNENEALELAREGRLDEAYALVNSPLYNEKKTVYLNGLYTAADSQHEKMKATEARILLKLVITIIAGAALSVIAILMIIRQHRNYQKQSQRLLTELRQKSIQLEQSLASERRQNEMQAQFVSMASHEFRTPLAIIDGTAQRLGKTAARLTPEQVQERVQTMRDAVSRMTILIERTLDASRLSAGKLELEPENFRLRTLVSNIVQRHASLSPGHQIQMDLSGLPPLLFGDPKLLDNVFSNIISNAIKYSKDDPRVEITSETRDRQAILHVKDYGIGIPKGELEQISDRFFRASTSYGIAGTGIGLNLAKTLIELHDGELTVESEVGAWTCLTISLPHRDVQDLRPSGDASSNDDAGVAAA